nr:hypothetical protein [Actinomycetota bacterium]
MTASRSRGRLLRTALAVVGVAAIQAALVALIPSPAAPAPLIAGAVASFAACVLGLAVAVREAGPGAAVPAVGFGRAVLFSLLATAAVSAAAIVSVFAGAAVIVLALGLVPLLTSGARATALAWRRRPVRGALRVLTTLLAIGLAATVSLLLGLFVTGWPASALSWLWFGTTAAALVLWWAASAHPRSVRTAV